MKKILVITLIILGGIFTTYIASLKNNTTKNIPQSVLQETIENKINSIHTSSSEVKQQAIIEPFVSKRSEDNKHEIISKELFTALEILDDKKMLSELIRLADIYTDNKLLQYLAAANCLNAKKENCDTSRFIDRLKSLDKNNAVINSLLIHEHLIDGNLDSALIEIQKISPDQTYESYFTDLLQSLEPAIKNTLTNKKTSVIDMFYKMRNDEGALSKMDMNQFEDLVTTVATQAMAEQSIHRNNKVIDHCLSNNSDNSQETKWSSVCKNYSSVMLKSNSYDERISALNLQLHLLKNTPDSNGFSKYKQQETDLKNLRATTNELASVEFILSSNFSKFHRDTIKLGEIEAMKILIESQPKN